jgi:type III secretion system (T3SS) inner membrane Yop/YscD-like protein
MPKFCNNGHQMEDSWELCPYCQRTGYQSPRGGESGGKTRLEMDPLAQTMQSRAAAAAPPQVAPRKTVLLSDVVRKTALVGWVVVMDGDQKGEDFRLRDGQNTVGSAPDSDIVLRDQTVSAKHASIRYKDGKFFLSDLDSSNGTFVNGLDDCVARIELSDSDMLRCGGVTLKFKAL